MTDDRPGGELPPLKLRSKRRLLPELELDLRLRRRRDTRVSTPPVPAPDLDPTVEEIEGEQYDESEPTWVEAADHDAGVDEPGAGNLAVSPIARPATPLTARPTAPTPAREESIEPDDSPALDSPALEAPAPPAPGVDAPADVADTEVDQPEDEAGDVIPPTDVDEKMPVAAADTIPQPPAAVDPIADQVVPLPARLPPSLSAPSPSTPTAAAPRFIVLPPGEDAPPSTTRRQRRAIVKAAGAEHSPRPPRQKPTRPAKPPKAVKPAKPSKGQQLKADRPPKPSKVERASSPAAAPVGPSPRRAPLYWRALRLHHVHPNGWQRAVLLEGVIGAAVVLVLAGIASLWTLLVLPVVAAILVKLHDVLKGGLVAPAPAPETQAHLSPSKRQSGDGGRGITD